MHLGSSHDVLMLSLSILASLFALVLDCSGSGRQRGESLLHYPPLACNCGEVRSTIGGKRIGKKEEVHFSY